MWQEKANQITPGMSKGDVFKILPPFPQGANTGGIWDGGTHIDRWQLDYHWTATVAYQNPVDIRKESTATVISRPVLKQCAFQVNVAPRKDFTGTWINWHVNGQKGLETQYKNGKYNGVLTSYHDNGSQELRAALRKPYCRGGRYRLVSEWKTDVHRSISQ